MNDNNRIKMTDKSLYVYLHVYIYIKFLFKSLRD